MTVLPGKSNHRAGHHAARHHPGGQLAIADLEQRNSEFYRRSQRKEAVSAEIKASLDLHFGGQGKEEKQLRLAVSEVIFAVKSKEAADQLPLEQLGRGLRILHAYEKAPQHNLDDKDSVLQQIIEIIREYDGGSRNSGRCRSNEASPQTDEACWAAAPLDGS